MPGAQCTRSLVWVKKPHELVTTSPPESPGIPARNGFNGLFPCSPRRPGFLATVACGIDSRKLDASVGASGPHAFAVRLQRPRRKHRQRPPHPAPRFVTLRNAPLWDGTG
jgi:hypothetical protein